MASEGAHIVLITARGPQSTALIEEQLGVLASYITFGGSLVWARESDGLVVLSERPLPTERVAQLIAIGRGFDAHIGIYSCNHWHVSRLDYWGLREARNTSIWPATTGDLGASVADPTAGPFFKVMFRGDAGVLDLLENEVRLVSEGLFVHRFPHVIEIVSADAVKLPALRTLLAHRGEELSDTIAFGDSESDAEVLGHVGVGVLMANGRGKVELTPRIEVTLSNDEDGVGVALRKHFPTDAPFRT